MKTRNQTFFYRTLVALATLSVPCTVLALVVDWIDTNGDPQTVGGSGVAVLGSGNVLATSNALAIGYTNIVSSYHTNVAMIGNQLRTGRGNSLVVGEYNLQSSSALFVVGSGTSSSNRKNALEVRSDDSIIMQKAHGGISMGNY